MGGELVTAPSPRTLSEIFDEYFPYYLAIGMPAEEYWHGDVTLAKAYRKADTLRRQRTNYEAWLQGAYIYEAICNASPLINAFSKEHKPYPYPERPYAITQEEVEERQKEKIKLAAEQFAVYAIQKNKERREKSGDR